MANIKKIALNGTSYDVVDATAVHTVDSALSSSSTNPVQNKIIKAELDKKLAFTDLGSKTISITSDVVSFSISSVTLSGDAIKVTSAAASAYRPNETLYALYSGTATINGVSCNIYSGTFGDGDLSSGTFTVAVPSTGTGTCYITEVENAYSADQLGEEVDVTDNVPYIYRPTGGDVLTGTSKYETLVGGTVAWNQFIKNGNFASGTTDWNVYSSSYSSISASGGILTQTIPGGLRASPYMYGVQQYPVGGKLVAGHKYLSMVTVKPSVATTMQAELPNGGQALRYTVSIPANTKTQIYFFFNPSSSVNNRYLIYPYSAVFNVTAPAMTVTYESITLTDLTVALGSTIADYIYSLETATAGAGVKWFRNLFSKNYYPYNAGELLSVMPTAEKSVGFNLFDAANVPLGTDITRSGITFSGTPGKIYRWSRYTWPQKYIAGKQYYIRCDLVNGSGAQIIPRIVYTDGTGTYGANPGTGNSGVAYCTSTAGKDVAEIYLAYSTGDSICTVTNICINIYDADKNGTYEPYKESTYPITPVELRGIPKLDSNNKLYYDGDIRNSDGTVTRKYGILDLGTYTWERLQDTTNNTYYFRTSASVIKPPANGNTPANMVCAIYTTVASSTVSVNNKTIGRNVSSYLYVRDDTYTTAADFKTAMSGVYLVYELATPTYEDAATFPNPQVVDPYGVEEFVDERTVAMPVGHESRYVTNLRKKLEEAPSVPVDDGRYVVETKNGVSNYVRETVKVYRTTDPDFTITKDATPSSGSLYSGTVTDYTYDKMLTDYQNGVIPMIVDDASILDPDEAFTFKFVSFYEDGDRFLFECDNMELRLYNQNDFTVYTKDYKSSSVPFYSCSTAINTAAKLVYGSGFDLVAGARIYVKFTNGNNANQPTLNINDTGGKYILSGGQYLKSTGLGTNGVGCYISPNSVLELIYDGTYWNVLDLRNQLFATSAYNNRLTDLNRSCAIPSLEYFLATSSTTSGKPPFDAHVLNMNWDNGTKAAAQLAVAHGADTHAGQLWTRAQIGTAATWTEWKEIPRLTSTPTNGQIMVSDQSTGLGLIKGGPTIDTADTTKFLRHDGTWAEAGSGGGSSGTCTLTDGMSISFTANYYKIGRQVTVWGTIPKYASTALGLSGLPYAASASMTSVVQFQNPASGGAMVSATLSVAAGYTTLGVIGYITGSSNNGMFVGNSTGSWLNMIPSTGLAFNFTYITDTP